MSFQLAISGINLPEVEDKLPLDYNGPVIKGAVVNAIKNNRTSLIVQELQYEDFGIRLSSGECYKKVEAKGWHSADGLYGSFMLKNGIRKKISTIGKVHLREGHHMLAYIGNADCSGSFDRKNEFQILDIFYTPQLFHQLEACFPDLSSALNIESPHIVGGRTYWTPPAFREIYGQLLNSPFEINTQQFYFGLKVREILLLVLQNSLLLNKVPLSFTPYEVARIHEAKSILESHIDKKTPTIRELSKMVAINEFKLKLGFRKYFGSGIFGWLTTQRMYRAKQLLENTNQPIKEIAALTGYPRITNFITSFRRQFGITPGAIRRS